MIESPVFEKGYPSHEAVNRKSDIQKRFIAYKAKASL